MSKELSADQFTIWYSTFIKEKTRVINVELIQVNTFECILDIGFSLPKNKSLLESFTAKYFILQVVKTLSSIGTTDKNRRPLYIHTHICVCAQLCPTLRPHGLQPSRLLCLWNFPGEITGVIIYFIYTYIYIYIYKIYLWLAFLEEMTLNFKLAIRLSEIKEQNLTKSKAYSHSI